MCVGLLDKANYLSSFPLSWSWLIDLKKNKNLSLPQQHYIYLAATTGPSAFKGILLAQDKARVVSRVHFMGGKTFVDVRNEKVRSSIMPVSTFLGPFLHKLRRLHIMPFVQKNYDCLGIVCIGVELNRWPLLYCALFSLRLRGCHHILLDWYHVTNCLWAITELTL